MKYVWAFVCITKACLCMSYDVSICSCTLSVICRTRVNHETERRTNVSVIHCVRVCVCARACACVLADSDGAGVNGVSGVVQSLVEQWAWSGWVTGAVSSWKATHWCHWHWDGSVWKAAAEVSHCRQPIVTQPRTRTHICWTSLWVACCSLVTATVIGVTIFMIQQLFWSCVLLLMVLLTECQFSSHKQHEHHFRTTSALQ